LLRKGAPAALPNGALVARWPPKGKPHPGSKARYAFADVRFWCRSATARRPCKDAARPLWASDRSPVLLYGRKKGPRRVGWRSEWDSRREASLGSFERHCDARTLCNGKRWGDVAQLPLGLSCDRQESEASGAPSLSALEFWFAGSVVDARQTAKSHISGTPKDRRLDDTTSAPCVWHGRTIPTGHTLPWPAILHLPGLANPNSLVRPKGPLLLPTCRQSRPDIPPKDRDRFALKRCREPRVLKEGAVRTALRISEPILISPLPINNFLGGNSCLPNGRRRTLVMIVKGSTELAKSLKTCLSRGSKRYMRTCQHPPRAPRRRRNSDLGASHVSSQPRRRCRRVQRRSKHQPIRSRSGEVRRPRVRPARYPLPNTVASALWRDTG